MRKKFDRFIVQGRDYKALRWFDMVPNQTIFFSSLYELVRAILLPGRNCIVFRYLNTDRRLSVEIFHLLIISVVCFFRLPLRLTIYWILHNIDRETVDYFPKVTRLKRKLLERHSRKIFVTDQYFKERFFSDDKKYEFISFGPKVNGQTSLHTLEAIKVLKKSCDRVGLCLGAAGAKYAHFDRIPAYSKEFEAKGLKVGFVLPVGVCVGLSNVIYVKDKNIDERALKGLVDFVYRINDDISMPYTIYAASGAGIPIVTSDKYFTYDIVKHYGIGFSEEAFIQAREEDLAVCQENMKNFVRGKSWTSLYDQIEG